MKAKYPHAYCPEKSRLVSYRELPILIQEMDRGEPLTFRCPEVCCGIPLIIMHRHYPSLARFRIYRHQAHQVGCKYEDVGDKRLKAYRDRLKAQQAGDRRALQLSDLTQQHSPDSCAVLLGVSGL